MADDTTTTGDTPADTSGGTSGGTATATTKRRPWQRDPSGSRGSGRPGLDATRLRAVLAQVLWGVCVLFALILAVAVLLIAVDANPANDLVRWVIERADNVDLGFFDLSNPVKDWDVKETDPTQDVKTALFNYGIAAIIWLGLGKFLDKVVRA